MFSNVVITDVSMVLKTDEKKYKNNFVAYNPRLISNELIYRPNGYSTVTFGGETFNTTPNSVYLLPHTNGGEYTSTFSEPDYFIDIFFHTDSPRFTNPIVLNDLKNNKINALFNKAFSCFVKKGAGYKNECISILYKIFAELEKNNSIPDSKFKKIEPAIKYIEQNFLTQDISCEDLAKRCGISYSYLQQIFSEKFGQPPKKYIIQLKINYACTLLQSGMYNVSQAATESGFNDPYFFSRQFKEYVGLSPKNFQKNSPK